MSEQPGGRPAGGKKILGMPRNAVIVGGVVFVVALVWFVIRQGKQQQAAQTATSADGTDYAGEISTLQSEFGDLASEISAMQGSGGGGSSGGGGTTLPAGPPGPAGPAGPAGPPGPRGPALQPGGPIRQPVSGMTAHQKHVAHMQHVAHQKRNR